MTLRDLFALAALQSADKLMGPMRPEDGSRCDQVAAFCYRMAGAMLVASAEQAHRDDEYVCISVYVDGGRLDVEG